MDIINPGSLSVPDISTCSCQTDALLPPHVWGAGGDMCSILADVCFSPYPQYNG